MQSAYDIAYSYARKLRAILLPFPSSALFTSSIPVFQRLLAGFSVERVRPPVCKINVTHCLEIKSDYVHI